MFEHRTMKHKKSTFFFVLALLIMATVGILSYWTDVQMKRSISEWEDSIDDMRGISSVNRALRDAESGQRGFLLTGEDHYLEPYRQAAEELPLLCERPTDNADTAKVHELSREVHALAVKKLAELDETIRLYRESGFEAAVTVVREGTGKRIMDSILKKSNRIYRLERAQWHRADAAMQAASAWHRKTIIVGNSMALLLLFVAFGISRTEQARREHYQDSLIEARLEAEAASQAKSDFLANMSHELRTPLNAIIGFSEVLLKGMMGPLSERQQDLIADVLDSGRHLLSLINDILSLSSTGTGQAALHRETVRLKPLVDRAVNLVVLKAQKKAQHLEITVNPETCEIITDEQAMLKVLFHILSNAVKFTPDGGYITLSATCNKDGRVRILVSDTGPGIDPGLREHLFQPFQQRDISLTRKNGGAGLGLYLSKSLVELNGGHIGLESKPGEGTTVVIELPAEPGEKEKEQRE